MFSSLGLSAQQTDNFQLNQQKMGRFLQFLKFFYVDTVDFDKIVEKGTIEMLKELDPHSIYISKRMLPAPTNLCKEILRHRHSISNYKRYHCCRTTY